MTVLGRGLVFQLVLITQTCTYNSNNKMTLQNIDITDYPSKKKKKKEKKRKEKEHTNPFSPHPPPPLHPAFQTHNNNNKRSHDTSEYFDISLKLASYK